MTPMRQAFVTALQIIEQESPAADRSLVEMWLIETMDRARDAEEAGAAAKFAAAAIIHLDARRAGGESEMASSRRDFEDLTRNLIAVMLLRRGRIKGASCPYEVASV